MGDWIDPKNLSSHILSLYAAGFPVNTVCIGRDTVRKFVTQIGDNAKYNSFNKAVSIDTSSLPGTVERRALNAVFILSKCNWVGDFYTLAEITEPDAGYLVELKSALSLEIAKIFLTCEWEKLDNYITILQVVGHYTDVTRMLEICSCTPATLARELEGMY